MSASRPSVSSERKRSSLARESKLARQLIGSGVTALGEADFADKKGQYYIAFFGLSIGLERLAKLVLAVEYAIRNDGNFPDPKFLKDNYGHNIGKLFDSVNDIKLKYDIYFNYDRPSDPICLSIVECLNDFSDASRGRYANFGSLFDPDLDFGVEPINQWWKNVAEPILEKHFYGTSADDKAKAEATLLDEICGGSSAVHQVSEDGLFIDSLYQSSYKSSLVKPLQKYSQYYSLVEVRWVAEVFNRLSVFGSDEMKIDILYGNDDHFWCYVMNDRHLKSRKRWPI